MLKLSFLTAFLIAIAPLASAENLVRNSSNPLAQDSSTPSSASQEDNLNRGFQLVIKARELSSKGDFKQSLPLFQEAIAIFRKEGDQLSESRTHSFVGDIYLRLSKPKLAIGSYQDSFNLISLIEKNYAQDPKVNSEIQFEKLVALQNIAFAFNRANQWQQAIAIYEKALAQAKLIKDFDREATILNNIGQIYVDIGKFSQGLESLQKALAIHQNNGKPEQSGGVLLNIGFAYRRLGQFEQAIAYYQQALEKLRAIGNRRAETSALNNLAGVYRSQGKYLLSLESYKASLLIAEELNLRSQKASTLSNIGVVYKELGQYDNALKYFNQALKGIQEIGDRQSESIFLSNIGSIYDDKNDPKQALNYYNKALKIHRELNDIPAQGITLNNIALAYSTLNQKEKALTTYQQSLDILQEIGDRSAVAITLSNIGLLQVEDKKYDKALAAYQQAVAVQQELGERRGASITLSNLGKLFTSAKQPELAILFYKQSVNIRESLRKELRSLSVDDQKTFTGTVAQTYRNLADLLLKQNRVLEAQQVLDLLKVQELDDYLKNVRGNGETAKGIEFLSPEQRFLTDYNAIQNRSIQAGRESVDILKINKSNRSAAQSQRLKELLDIQSQASKQLIAYVQSPAVSTILKQISKSDGSNSGDASLQQFAALQKNLQQRSSKLAIFYPLILEDRLELILVTANGSPIRRTVAVTRAELNRAIVNFRSDVRDPSSLDILDSAQQLYDWLIAPIANDLEKAEVQTIIYAPDGQLRYLPIAALHDRKKWLVERYAINTITAASLTNLGERRPSSQPRVLAGAFANGRYAFEVNGQPFNFAGLPFASKEVDSLVAKLPNSSKLVDSNFSVEATVSKFKQYNIIHFATHAAFVVGKPEDSFVMFGDGSRASLRDVATWSLQNIDLVILSACETGLGGKLGNGTEIMGFGYQMEYAGAKAAIASLWQVSDGGTQALMEFFYSAIQDVSLTKAEVLAKSQRAMIATSKVNDFSHPYYWSPFIIIGNGL
ncbi:MAG: hypothetical protein DCE90_07125 [Pseudanabaena sp.]|nr:MAG: hypothetical protein DCE90_07125 [Pseudanabaena sp.]